MEYEAIELDRYNILESKAYEIINDASTRLSAPYVDISAHDIFNLFCDDYNITLVGFTSIGHTPLSLISDGGLLYFDTVEIVDPTVTATVDGFTIKKNDSYVLELNLDLISPRLTYTLLHELAHIKFHLDDLHTRLFKMNPNIESESGDIFEIEANYIASTVFMCDEKVRECFRNHLSYDQMMSVSGMSNTALFNRLKNWLIYSLKLNPDIVPQWIASFRSGHNSFLPDFISANNFDFA